MRGMKQEEFELSGKSCRLTTNAFTAIAAASPSVWYPGWMDFARTRQPKVPRIYLSLGDAEEKTIIYFYPKDNTSGCTAGLYPCQSLDFVRYRTSCGKSA